MDSLVSLSSAPLTPLPALGAYGSQPNPEEFRQLLASQGLQASGGAPSETEARITAAPDRRQSQRQCRGKTRPGSGRHEHGRRARPRCCPGPIHAAASECDNRARTYATGIAERRQHRRRPPGHDKICPWSFDKSEFGARRASRRPSAKTRTGGWGRRRILLESERAL